MKKTKLDRRHFLKQTAAGAGLAVAWPSLLAPNAADLKRPIFPREAGTIVFQGDSITDAGRDKENQEANRNRSMGSGYVGLIVAQLLGEHPGEGWQCYNRGISGNKVFQLAERWQADCLDLKPNILSILIGVNDFWHTLSNNYDGTVQVYETDLRALLDRTKETLPDVKLIIGEPFAVAGGRAIDEQWSTFGAYQQVALQITKDYGAIWIPYQRIFDEALEKAPVSYWCPDGVHPVPPGNYLMAQAWLDALHTALHR